MRDERDVHEGGCHCGAVRFQVRGPLEKVTVCNCSVCTKKGYLHWIVSPDRFELLAGEGVLTTYEFGTRTAKHRFCGRCGVQAFYVPRSDPDKIDVNVRCLDDVDLATLEVASFDGRNWERAMTTTRPPWR